MFRLSDHLTFVKSQLQLVKEYIDSADAGLDRDDDESEDLDFTLRRLRYAQALLNSTVRDVKRVRGRQFHSRLTL